MIDRVLGAIRRRHTANKTFHELSRLSDRELSDIGLTRGDLRGVANRAA